MAQQIALDQSARAVEREIDGVHEIAPDLAYQRLQIVNLMYFGVPHCADRQWVLVDAGVLNQSGKIEAAAKARFGASRPSAIILTHGHFDHVGALQELAETWDAPIYAHRLEFPFLTGLQSYPPPDPSVGGGMMALLSPLYPKGPIDVSSRLQELLEDGTVPGMPGWKWIHAPGHAPGHVSLWRESDRTLIVGDAFVTTAQESAYSAATQELEMHGPPMYFTPDWASAKTSVQTLAALQPELVITGHGRALHGSVMRGALEILARDFDDIAVPDHGRHVMQKE